MLSKADVVFWLKILAPLAACGVVLGAWLDSKDKKDEDDGPPA
jgi:hypothetical protein